VSGIDGLVLLGSLGFAEAVPRENEDGRADEEHREAGGDELVVSHVARKHVHGVFEHRVSVGDEGVLCLNFTLAHYRYKVNV
jgi:hypothetical protein